MPTSNASYNDFTTGFDVTAEYAAQVKDKVVLITGANPGGIGSTTAISLAKASPKLLILAGRGSGRLATVTEAIKKTNPSVAVKSLILDLSSQDSCREAAKQVLEDADIPHIDILINNAGVMNIPERTLSTDGIETQFATNHIGHFLFSNLILPKIVTAAKSSTPGSTRIINLSSRAVQYGPVRFSDWNFTKTQAELPEEEHMSQQVRELWNQLEDKPYIPQSAYGQSKTANVLFSLSLNEKLFKQHGILSLAVHPGGIMTELGRHMDQAEMQAAIEKFQKASPAFRLKDLDQGCSTTLVAALDPKLQPEELFLADCQIASWAPAYATDPKLAEQLWSLSEEIVGEKFAL